MRSGSTCDERSGARPVSATTGRGGSRPGARHLGGRERDRLASPFLFPPPSRVAGGLAELWSAGFPDGIRIWQHLGVTLARIFQGFVIAMALAVPLGLVIGRASVLDRLLAPIVTFARSIATLSLLPLAIVWFGIGETSKVFLIAYACFWVMPSNVIAAVKYVDPILVRAARTMDVEGQGCSSPCCCRRRCRASWRALAWRSASASW